MSLFGLGVCVLVLISKITMKKGPDYENIFKAGGICLSVLIVSFILFPSSGDKQAIVDHEELVEEKDDETKEDTVEEQASKTEESDSQEKELDPEKIKEVYLNEAKPELDLFMIQYDDIWEAQWRPTLQKIADGNFDQHDAYKQIESVKLQYELLSERISKYNLPDEIDGDYRKNLNSFLVDMQDAAYARREAARMMMKMIDQRDFSPSKMDQVQERIDASDEFLFQAIESLTSFENQLDIER